MEVPPRQFPLLPQPWADPSSVSIQEKRKRQTEIENKRRQLEDDRRQLQHLKVRTTPPPGDPGVFRGCVGTPKQEGGETVTLCAPPVQGAAGEMAAGGGPILCL